jgi:hypothetical protein
MVALLVLSSIAAALVPVERDRRNESTQSSTTSTATAPAGGLVARTVRAGAAEPASLELRLGAALALRVTAARPDQVAIPRLGELDDVDPDAPARFDLLPAEAGRYAVRLVEARRTIARIEVSPRKRRSSAEPRSPSG